MLKIIVLLSLIVVLSLVLAGITFINKPQNPVTQAKVPTPVPSVITTTVTPEPESHSLDYFYPLNDYSSRIEERKYGQYFTGSSKVNAPCGKPFVGYHTGDDLETSADELNVEVPVVAAATGKIQQVAYVSGYGGLIVESAVMNTQPVTIYYGHIDLSSTKLKAGDNIDAGEFIANLGAECSTETDDARKHLHFAIKKGTGVDIRGYAPTPAVLSTWIDPEQLLSSLNASSPE